MNAVIANDDHKKEKKALLKTIKKEYVSWLVRDYNKWLVDETNSANADNSDSIKKAIASISLQNVQFVNNKFEYIPDPVVSANQLKEFKFQIKNDQAVVKFMVDQHLKSAFLEKEGGKWKLLFVANQDAEF